MHVTARFAWLVRLTPDDPRSVPESLRDRGLLCSIRYHFDYEDHVT